VLGVDLVADKLQMARDFGADVVVNAGGDVVAAVQAFTGGAGVDSAIIMASAQGNQPLEQAAEICRERGRVVATGLVGLEIPRKPFYEKEIEFVVSRAWGAGMVDPDYEERDVKYPLPYVRWTAQRNMAAFLDLIAGGRVDVGPLITHRFPFDRALDAYRMILAGEEPYIGVVLEYEQAEAEPVHCIDLSPRGRDSSRLVAARNDGVGIGLIGAGLYARGTLLPALQKIKGVRYIGVATASGLSGRHAGDKYGFDYCTTDYRELLDDESVQAVFVLTRHGSHARFVVEALRAGKAVFVEKPLALDGEQLREVVRAYYETVTVPNGGTLNDENLPLPLRATSRAPSHEGRGNSSPRVGEARWGGAPFLMVGFNRRFAPTTRFVQERLAGGAGPLVAYCRCNAGYIPPDSWVHDPQQGGGRIVGEACHFVDLLQALTGGLPVEVCVAAADGANAPLRDNLACSIKLDNGSVGSLVYAAGGDKSFPREYVEVFGRGAVATVDNFRAASFASSGRAAKKRGLGVDRGHVGELEVFFDHLRGGRPQPVPMRDYVATTLATFAMEASITRREAAVVDVDGFLRGCLE
jgi:predicted dehydrogenase